MSEVAASPAPRPWRFAGRAPLVLWLAAGIAAALAFLALGWFGVPSGVAFSICAFRHLTGIPCPGCGLTRAMAALARGELVLALHFHPFAPLLAAEAALLWAAVGAAVVRRQPFTLPPRLVERLLVWQGAGLMALWIGRLATGTLPW